MDSDLDVFRPQSDEELLTWISRNAEGYILASDKPSYNKVHRARCQSFTMHKNQVRKGVIKVCANKLTAIKAWAKEHPDLIRVSLSRCMKCDPPPLDLLPEVESMAYVPTEDPAVLDERVRQLMVQPIEMVPEGVPKPAKTETATIQYKRDPDVKRWVMQNAGGKCELCGNNAPFLTKGGLPFLEVHHVLRLADGGSDTIENAVALCPNCHRRCHLALDADEATEKMYSKVIRLRR